MVTSLDDDNNLVMHDVQREYYDYGELGDQLNGLNDFVIIHQNIRSFSCNFDVFSVGLSQVGDKVDVIVLTETWFRDGLCGDIEGFTGYHMCRSEKAGGRVSIYVRNDHPSSFLDGCSSVDDSLEVCSVEVVPDSTNINNKIRIIGCYRPPCAPLPHFYDKIQNILDSNTGVPTVYSGDFNIDLLNDENADMCGMFYAKYFYPVIIILTRVTDATAKYIDHIWYDGLNASFSGAIVSDVSDHYSVFVVLNIVNNNGTFTHQFRDHSKNNVDLFIGDVEGLRDSYFAQCTDKDFNFKTEWFVNNLWELYCRRCLIRIKPLSVKRYLKPWVTRNIQRMINYKHTIFKQYKQAAIPLEFYNRYKNNVSRI